ncbi:DUF5412 domain-containing protein [Metabacillus dongyingensis]|uniref:DUF5412 domain-containing protein n=1 Tax=Metabacillus dongyingensis TaxID=2874282 RepID=UPI003B8CCED8
MFLKQKNMTSEDEKKSRYKGIIKGFSIVGLLVIAFLGYGVYWAFYDMNRLPTGVYLTEVKSPDGKYTLKAYVTNGGATTSYSLRGELVFNKEENKSKNIYWNYRENSANITWRDNDIVVINGHTLEVPSGKYDFRHQ